MIRVIPAVSGDREVVFPSGATIARDEVTGMLRVTSRTSEVVGYVPCNAVVIREDRGHVVRDGERRADVLEFVLRLLADEQAWDAELRKFARGAKRLLSRIDARTGRRKGLHAAALLDDGNQAAEELPEVRVS